MKNFSFTNPFFATLLGAGLLATGWLAGSGVPLLLGLVPLLWIAERAADGGRKLRHTALWAALTFGLWSAMTTWWIWEAAAIGAILSVVITAGLMGGVFVLFAWVWRRAPKALAYTTLVAGWIAAEYLYTVGQVSFPWLTLGNGLANDTKLVQWYCVTGVFGGSLWILVSNIVIYEALRRPKISCGVVAGAVVALPMIASIVMYHTWDDRGREVKISVVQPNIDPYEKFSTDQDYQNQILFSLVRQAPAGVDYVVMPETAIDDRLWEGRFEASDSYVELARIALRFYPATQFIVGASTFRAYDSPDASPTAREGMGYWYDVYNSALAVTAGRAAQVHHKSKLVVGVEKMPYYNILRHLEFLIVDLGGITGQLGTDTVHRVFTSPAGVRSSAAICFESVYGAYLAEYARAGAQLFFVITNDGWWGDTAGHRHHFAYARLRAIEMRRSIARSANTGISGFINARGDVLQTLDWDQRGVITDTLATNDRLTFYVRYGDAVARIACYVFGLSLLYLVAYRIRRRNHLQ